MERQQNISSRFRRVPDRFDRSMDLIASRHEHENVTAALLRAFCKRVGRKLPDSGRIVTQTPGKILRGYRIGSSLRTQEDAGVEIFLQSAGIESGGHNDNKKIGPST